MYKLACSCWITILVLWSLHCNIELIVNDTGQCIFHVLVLVFNKASTKLDKIFPCTDSNTELETSDSVTNASTFVLLISCT